MSLRYLKVMVLAVGLLFVPLRTNGVQQDSASHTEHEASFRYEVAGIRLSGRLMLRHVYGPPGYGETPRIDAKTSIFVLKLGKPISVEPAEHADENHSIDSDPAKDVREVQLFLGSSLESEGHKLIAQAHALIGRDITVTGSLSESITASQYTKVLMDVTALDLK